MQNDKFQTRNLQENVLFRTNHCTLQKISENEFEYLIGYEPRSAFSRLAGKPPPHKPTFRCDHDNKLLVENTEKIEFKKRNSEKTRPHFCVSYLPTPTHNNICTEPQRRSLHPRPADHPCPTGGRGVKRVQWRACVVSISMSGVFAPRESAGNRIVGSGLWNANQNTTKWNPKPPF